MQVIMANVNNTLKVKTFTKHTRKLFEAFLSPLSFLDLMPSINENDRLSILRFPDEHLHQVHAFIDAFENCESPGIIAEFLDAIKQTDDQKFLYPLFDESTSCEDIENFYQYYENIDALKRLWQLLQPELRNIHVEDCVRSLTTKFISQEEKERLLRKCQNYGNCYALMWLFSTLTGKQKGWIQELIDHFEECNYATSSNRGTVAELIKRYIDTNDDPGVRNLPEPSHVTNTQHVTSNNEIVELCDTFQTLNISVNDVEEADLKSTVECASSDVISGQISEEAGDLKDGAVNERPPVKEEKKLRGYQKELVQLAEKGKNVIICAPPGSGKTIVAAHLVRHYLETRGNSQKSVLFFTPGGALAQQQKDRLSEYLPNDLTVDSCFGNAGTTESSGLIFHEADVIVLTPQMLLNSIKEDKTNISEKYGLFIFDECHHCMKGHPYNTVMREYFELKRKVDAQALPQIVGLTATLGVGKSAVDAVEGILKLCSNLNAVDGIVSVQDPKNIQEMHRYIPHPEDNTLALQNRQNDPFFKELVALMNEIVEKMKSVLAGDSFEPPPSYCDCSDAFEPLKQWCVVQANEISKSEMTGSRDAFSCIKYLENCGEARDLHLKCQPINAVEFLVEYRYKVQIVLETSNVMEMLLYQLLEKSLDKLKKLCDDKACQNPNLKLIEDLILKKFKKEPDSTGMLMVEQRKYTKAIKSWMNNNKELKFLQAEIFTGVGSKSDSTGTGLTHKQQESVMKKFREGAHKILICTPEAAGEGMDVKECNLVINYDYMKSEIGTVQIAGRVRKHKGQVIDLSSHKVSERDRLNLIKMKIMMKAATRVQELVKSNVDQYRSKLLKLQEAARKEDAVAMLAKLARRPMKTDKECQIQCRKCQVDVCSSLDIRVVEGGQHTNATEAFSKKYTLHVHPRKQSMGPDWKKLNKVLCKNCSNDWGIEAIWRDQIPLPLIKIEGFRVIVRSGERRKVFTPKKWKDSPFQPIEGSLIDIMTDVLANDTGDQESATD